MYQGGNEEVALKFRKACSQSWPVGKAEAREGGKALEELMVTAEDLC